MALTQKGKRYCTQEVC